VTGHTPEGKSVVVSDDDVAPFPIGESGPGDIVVQNGTRHRWHNRGDTIARMLSVTVGAYHRIEGGRPI
jgi:hypothetical protein